MTFQAGFLYEKLLGWGRRLLICNFSVAGHAPDLLNLLASSAVLLSQTLVCLVGAESSFGWCFLGAWPWFRWCLPLVSGAITTTEGVALGVLEGIQDGFIDRAEVHAAMQSESFGTALPEKFPFSLKRCHFTSPYQLIQFPQLLFLRVEIFEFSSQN